MGIDFSRNWADVLGRVWLAPMTGVSDLPFRETAAAQGARYLATEMVACESLLASRAEAVRRAAVGDSLPLMIVQLVGAEPAAVAQAARLSQAAGAQVVDLNFGCPAKSVTGQACGSALMREPELLETIVRAACEATEVPVTVKMRLGWDEASRNAPELAQRVAEAGARAVTIHGRTRAQFYAGAADWAAVRGVRAAIDAPVIVNGDVRDTASARAALQASGAEAVMVGRGAIGRPWIARVIEAGLGGRSSAEPGPEDRLAIVVQHLRRSLAFYGERLGLLMFRKHLAAYVEAAPWPADPALRRAARARLCRLESPREVEAQLGQLWTSFERRMAA
jgi:tRNA-dihydrouridine synthase B